MASKLLRNKIRVKLFEVACVRYTQKQDGLYFIFAPHLLQAGCLVSGEQLFRKCVHAKPSGNNSKTKSTLALTPSSQNTGLRIALFPGTPNNRQPAEDKRKLSGMQSEISPAKGLNMKLGLSLLMLAIAGSVVPDAAAGQKARPDPVAVHRKDKRFRVAVSLLLILLTGCAARDESTEQERGAQMDVQKMADIDSKYRSTEEDWLAFLGCWRDAVSKRLPDGGLPTEVNRTVAVGSAVYEQQRVWLDKLEKHIGLKLPKSYKEYAHITGGRWLVESAGSPTYYSTPSNLSPINSVGKFMEVDQLNWGVWTKAASRARGREVPPDVYYRYGYFEESTERQDLSLVRWKDLDYLIKVGELEQGTVLLINPFEITSDGEWEAWMLSPQLAGAARYRSFAEMMQHIAYQDVLESGGVFLPPAKLQETCARYLKTAANTR